MKILLAVLLFVGALSGQIIGPTGPIGPTGAQGVTGPIGATGATGVISNPLVTPGTIYPSSATTDFGSTAGMDIFNAGNSSNKTTYNNLFFGGDIEALELPNAQNALSASVASGVGLSIGNYGWVPTYVTKKLSTVPVNYDAVNYVLLGETAQNATATATTTSGNQQANVSFACFSDNPRVYGYNMYRTPVNVGPYNTAYSTVQLIPYAAGTMTVSGINVTLTSGPAATSAWVGRMVEYPGLLNGGTFYIGAFVVSVTDGTHIVMDRGIGNGSYSTPVPYIVTPTMLVSEMDCSTGVATYLDSSPDASLDRPLGASNSTGGTFFKQGVPFLTLGENYEYYNYSVFLGFGAGNHRISGFSNYVMGGKSFQRATTARFNASVGGPWQYITTGTNNSGLGNGSLFNLTSGGYNAAVGDGSCLTVAASGDNSCFGAGADTTTDSISGSTALGYNTKVAKSDTFSFGSGVQSAAIVKNVLFDLSSYTPPSDYQFLINGKHDWLFGLAAQNSGAGKSLTYTSGDAATGSSNTNGGDVFVGGGKSSGTGCSVTHIQAVTPGSSGSGVNGRQDYITIDPCQATPIQFTAPTMWALGSGTAELVASGNAVAVGAPVKWSLAVRVQQVGTGDTNTEIAGIAATSSAGCCTNIQVIRTGIAKCTLDGSNAADNHWVGVSATAVGTCTDLGSDLLTAIPTTTATIGKVRNGSNCSANALCTIEVIPGHGLMPAGTLSSTVTIGACSMVFTNGSLTSKSGGC